MMEGFSVEEEGFEEHKDNEMNLLQNFVSYIKHHKIVVLEDLAAKFLMRTRMVINTIKELQNDDRRSWKLYLHFSTVHNINAVPMFIKQ